MGFTVTLLLVLACLAVGAVSFRLHFKKRDSLKPAPFMPWIIVTMASLATGVMLFVHLVNLLGFETGR